MIKAKIVLQTNGLTNGQQCLWTRVAFMTGNGSVVIKIETAQRSQPGSVK